MKKFITKTLLGLLETVRGGCVCYLVYYVFRALIKDIPAMKGYSVILSLLLVAIACCCIIITVRDMGERIYKLSKFCKGANDKFKDTHKNI